MRESCGRAMPGRTPQSITSPFWPTRSTNSLPNGVLDTTSVTTRPRRSIGVLIRADAGGASPWFAEECVDRNLEYSFGFHIGHRVRDGVMCVPTGCWHPAVDAGGTHRDHHALRSASPMKDPG